MATVAVTSNTQLYLAPGVLVRKLVGTGGATSLAYTHGENRSPDLSLAACKTESGTVTTVSMTDTSATVVTIDCLGDAANAIEVYLIWLTSATGGLNPPA